MAYKGTRKPRFDPFENLDPRWVFMTSYYTGTTYWSEVPLISAAGIAQRLTG